MRLRWPADAKYELDSPPGLELAGQPTAMIRFGNFGDSSGVVVADSSGTVSLIRGKTPRVERSWQLTMPSETITAGPWVIGDRAFVVVEGKKLIAIDQSAEKPGWNFSTPGDGISFAPTLIDGKLVIADQSGSFLALDPTSGHVVGRGFRHPAAVAPTASPVDFGSGRFLVTLTDGSALVMPVADLTKP
jgi:outer membrane protein assembly factor BamB